MKVWIIIFNYCHEHTNHGIWWSMDDEATIYRATNMELEVTRLGTLEALSDETMKLGSHREHEDRDEEDDKMEWNENIRLCVNDWCWIPWKGPRRLQVFIL